MFNNFLIPTGNGDGQSEMTYEEITLTANQNTTVDIKNGVYRIGAAIQNAAYSTGYIHNSTWVSQYTTSYATVSYANDQLTVSTNQANTKLFLYKTN